jgi:HTH-type transcriptional regulator / antitoxin HigA
MVSLGWIRKTASREESLEEVLSFFGIGSSDQWEPVWKNYQPAFRQNQKFTKIPEAVSAWLRRGEIESHEIQCAEFNRRAFQNNLSELRKLTLTTNPDEFVPILKNTCATCGAAVVLVPELKNTVVFGATRWLSPNKALIQLSLRYKTNDQLWFTFFHEAGHLLLHGKKQVFVDSQEQANIKEEREADQFAANLLVPQKDYREFLRQKPYSFSKIRQFSKRIGIAPGIVVGRLQHDRHIPFNAGQGLKVRY